MAHISQAQVLMVIEQALFVNQTYVDCYLLKYYDFQSKTYVYPPIKKKISKTIFIKFVYLLDLFLFPARLNSFIFSGNSYRNTQNLVLVRLMGRRRTLVYP